MDIKAFVDAAVADGWTLRASMAPDSGIPAEAAGTLIKDGLRINYVLMDEPMVANVRGPGGMRPRTMPAQAWIEGVNARGWPMELPETYDQAAIDAAAASAAPPAE